MEGFSLTLSSNDVLKMIGAVYWLTKFIYLFIYFDANMAENDFTDDCCLNACHGRFRERSSLGRLSSLMFPFLEQDH